MAALKQVEAGCRVEDVAREVGVSKHTLYSWKAKYGGMDVREAQEAKQLRGENARLKKLVADLSLDQRRATVGDSKKRVGLVEMKASVEHLRTTFAFSERRACRLIGLAVSTFRYRAIADDTALRTRLIELARERPRFGYRRLQVLLDLPEAVNHKRVWGIYGRPGLRCGDVGASGSSGWAGSNLGFRQSEETKKQIGQGRDGVGAALDVPWLIRSRRGR